MFRHSRRLRRSLPAALIAAPLVLALGWLAPPSAAHADFIDHFANPQDVGAAKVPNQGEARILVLTLEVEGYPPLDMEAIRRYFDPQPAGEEPRFTDFYERMSRGAYRPVAEVLDPLHYEACPLPEDYFGYEACSIPRGGGPTTAQKLESLDVGLVLLEELLRRADQELGVDFTRYDTNGPQGQPDGWIDGVLLLHNINFGGIALPLYALRSQGVLMLDGVGINMVGISESPAVALHEFGHLLGWADLYDESGATHGLQYSHMGSWHYVEPPPALDAFSRMVAGWTEPSMVLTQGDKVLDLRLPPAADTGAVVQLGDGEEFFLLENRGPSPGDYIDAGLATRGLAIYHVNLDRYPSANDGQWALRLADCLNCSRWAPMLMNEQADGLFELQQPGSRRDDADDLFLPGDELLPLPGNTRPLSGGNRWLSSNRYDGSLTGISVQNIRLEGEDILVDVEVSDPCALLSCGELQCEDGRCVAGSTSEPEEMDPMPGEGQEPGEDELPEELVQSQDKEGCAAAPGAPARVAPWGAWLWGRR